jgi:hypothetical protein
MDAAWRTMPRIYLRRCREERRATSAELTDEKAGARSQFGRGGLSCAELLLYNLRRARHHAARLNLILQQRNDAAPGRVAGAVSR